MVLRALIGIFLLTAAVDFCARAEEGAPIRAKTVVHQDGSYTETVIDKGEMASRATTFDAAGKVIGKVLNRLNANLEPLTCYTYDPAGKPLYWTDLKRDLNGKVTEVIDYTPQNKLIRRVVYSYDSFGKVIGVKKYDSEGREIVAPKKR